MSFSFTQMKTQASDMASLKDKIAGTNEGYQGEDNYFPGVDSSNAGWARVRLMPAADGTHMAEYNRWNWSRGAKSINELSPRNIGKPDPIQEYRTALYKAKDDSRMAIKKKQGAICYVYVVEDKVTSDFNGKIMRHYPTWAVREKIKAAINPPEDKFAETQPVPFNPFDIFGVAGGRDLIIKIKDREGNRNYDDSHFVDDATAWLPDEAEMERLWKETFDGEDNKDRRPSAILKEDRYKSYDELLKLVVDMVGVNDPIIREIFADKLVELDLLGVAEKKQKSQQSESRKQEDKTMSEDKPSEQTFDDGDDDFDFD